MNDIITIKEKPVIPEKWDYNISVNKCENLFKKVREAGSEALTEFYIAYIILIEDSKKKMGRKYPDKTFKNYCEDIGINERTGERWLHKYFRVPMRISTNVGIALPEGKFNVLLMDPPWKYENTGFEMSSNQKYEVLDLEEIKNYKDFNGKLITEIITDNAVLFLWVTNPMLREGLEVMQAWGFEYKTNFVWIKNNHTAGFYVFGKSELLLLGVKGEKMLPNKLFINIIEGENVIHSKKPEIVYNVIEEMYPDGKYIEGFARKRRPNWAVFGNEILSEN